ncbi:A disintegrin and metalloproteinase with thrombospondin motifs adt-1-like [Mercenaria mercenaria]|uniref:A disintegrin and metalloproteinase with thrombospondin motifs adt-1-like n=1 Tax=Mercenaria mercenaria TaxID=6596 RepID=UPI00234EBA79|nr:A disintegrin and metalloproteinase with thrombospondin motifs adt-1-like [Mercenaria mercenaria]
MKLGTALAYIFGIAAMATAYTRDGFKSTARPFTIRPKVNRSVSEDSDEKLNAKRDTRSAGGFPQELKYVITFDGKSDSELHLVRDHSHVLPPGFQQDLAGRFYRKPITNDLNVAFYKDLNGHGLFACQRQKSALEEFECGFSAMLDIGEETCYIGLGASHADCSAKTDGPFETLLEPIKEITLGNEAVRNKRSILPARGFKIVEVAYLPDAKFTDLFYRRHPGDIAAAEAEMLIFGTLLTNEINMYYSTLKETSNGDLDIQVYPTAVAIPGYKKNFPWSENYNDGTSLSATDDMKENLEYIINDSGFISERFDFVFALTGFNLKDSQTGSPIVSLTYLRTICTNSREKYAVTEFTSWNLPRVLAHELGHALGAEHDDDSSCPSGVNLMSLYLFAPNSTTKDTYYYFSTCSVDDISAHLNSLAFIEALTYPPRYQYIVRMD